MDEQDMIDLLELQRLTRELLDHLTAMFSLAFRRTAWLYARARQN